MVEDEPQVLELISSHLSQLGYDVTAVSTGPEALAIFDKGAGFDLLLTDVVLPGGVSGLELVQRARDIDARVKVLLTSGYSKEVFHPHGGIDPALSILRKPYRRDDLAQQLRQIFYSKA